MGLNTVLRYRAACDEGKRRYCLFTCVNIIANASTAETKKSLQKPRGF